jgi:hypothetical protein
MDTSDAIAKVRLLIDREDTAYLNDTDISGFILSAIDEFIQQYYQVFESSQDAKAKLGKLVSTTSITVSDASPYTLSTESDHYRIASIVMSDAPNKPLKLIQLADLSAYHNDPFNKADKENPVGYISEGKVNSIGLESSTSLKLYYVKSTTSITDLPIHSHEEVCQIAARKVLATLGDPRYQIFQAEITERRV